MPKPAVVACGRTSLESIQPDEAVAIGQAVVQSFLDQNKDHSRTTNREQTEILQRQLKKLQMDIDATKHELKFLGKNPEVVLNPKTETDPAQPTFHTVTPEQFAKLVDQQVRCDHDYLEAVAQLEATRSVRERNSNKLSEELETLFIEEFQKDPNASALADLITEVRRLGESNEQTPPPSVIAAREHAKKLTNDYEMLRVKSTPTIRARLAAADRGPLSDSKIRELEVAVEKARRKKDALAQQIGKIEVDRRTNGSSFEVTYLQRHLDSLMTMEDQVQRNLERLKFESTQDRYRVTLVDPAAVPKTPSHIKRLRYMAIAPVAIFFALLSLFLVQEIAAARRA